MNLLVALMVTLGFVGCVGLLFPTLRLAIDELRAKTRRGPKPAASVHLNKESKPSETSTSPT